MTRLSGIVVSHGHARELETLLPVLAPQVDELVVVANRPGSVPSASDSSATTSAASPATSTSAGSATVTTGVPDAIASTTGRPKPS